MTEVRQFTTENFEEQVLQAEGKVLVDFWASWCGPCKMIAPLLEKLAEEDLPGLIIGKVDVDAHPELARKYRVMSIPALKVFSAGQVVQEQIGAVPYDQLLALVSE